MAGRAPERPSPAPSSRATCFRLSAEHCSAVSTTMIYTHVMAKPGMGVRSPLDRYDQHLGLLSARLGPTHRRVLQPGRARNRQGSTPKLAHVIPSPENSRAPVPRI